MMIAEDDRVVCPEITTLNPDAMAKLLLLALIGSASALVLPTARAGVTAARVPAMTMISMPFGNNAREVRRIPLKACSLRTCRPLHTN
tara:strand:- start:1046 stop:1309 length:264 start_codon:yes stop_codon:yes gene_type:complete